MAKGTGLESIFRRDTLARGYPLRGRMGVRVVKSLNDLYRDNQAKRGGVTVREAAYRRSATRKLFRSRPR
jgi:hypothetical protein